jgi:non-heme chloroperoxidase
MMSTFTTKDGTSIFYKDQASGQPVVFSHGWPLSADAWDAQMFFLGQQGFRVIAHDRRSHGRSSQTWDGNNIDQYADDLAELLDHLDVKDAVLVGIRPAAARWRATSAGTAPAGSPRWCSSAR